MQSNRVELSWLALLKRQEITQLKLQASLSFLSCIALSWQNELSSAQRLDSKATLCNLSL